MAALRAAPPVAVPRRLRLFFRCAFSLLLAATLGLALDVLHDEKERSHRNYAEGLRKSEAQIAARLRHPTGQLMLLNAAAADLPATPLTPLVLPFGAIDFDDRAKAQQAVELAGCGVVYGDGATLCAGIGSNPFAGAFVYVVGQVPAAALVPHRSGQLDLSPAHRVWVEVRVAGGESWRWIAPFQSQGDGAAAVGATPSAQRGRLVAFDADAEVTADSRPLREVRGWIWQEGGCIDERANAAPAAGAASASASVPASASAAVPASASAASAAPSAAGSIAPADCLRRTYVSMRLPIQPWREALDLRGASAWPPADLANTQVRLQLLAPGEGQVLFDSDNPGRGGTAAASAPFALAEFRRLLLPGETLRVQREGSEGVILEARGADAREAGATHDADVAAPWIDTLIGWLPVPGFDAPIESRSTIATRLGQYRLTLHGDLRTVNRQLAGVATRLAGYVGAMLGAVLFVWLLLEVVVMRRIALLTRRAAAVSEGMRAGSGGAVGNANPGTQRLNLTLDVKDLSGRDELGVLAQGLRDLLTRVNADIEREQIRTRQERDQWHAVGHEIVSPLQSLMALHGDDADPASRYLKRMQQAVRVLYGQASPSEAFEGTQLTLAPLDLDAFATMVAGNAQYIGIADVVHAPFGQPAPVLADEHSLEDVLTHLLRNAERHRTPGTPITLALATAPGVWRLSVHNRGEPIAPEMLERIFEYGVSGRTSGGAPAAALGAEAGEQGQRGQGLFVARTYLAKMGGTIEARNVQGVAPARGAEGHAHSGDPARADITQHGVSFEITLPRADPPVA